MNPNIELIDRYLSDNMDSTERQAFEKALLQDPILQQQLEQIRQLRAGIQHKALKELVSKSFRSYKLWKLIKTIFIIALIAIAIGTGAYALLTLQNEKTSYLPNSSKDSISLMKHYQNHLLNPELEVQYASVDNSTGSIIESRDGLLLAIPADALVDNDGNVVKGKVTYAFQEALKPEQIMLAGLSTTSNNQVLETAGMFQISAYQEDKPLNINPAKKIMIKVPTDELKANMKLFKGVKNEAGSINWVDPKPLSRDLIPVDIESLDFYPPDYIKALHDLGLYKNDKHYLDSLYYAFSAEKKQPESESESCYDYKRIEPVSIETIWNSKYNNTLLATKEFEERLQYLHTTCQNEALELYINNLDKNMYEIDEMVVSLFNAEAHKQKFKAFASQGLGKVQTDSDLAKLLSRFYARKKKINQEILEKTYANFKKKQNTIKAEIQQLEKKGNHIRNEHIAQMIEEEIKFNTAAVYKQLGLKPCERAVANNYYTVEVTDFNTYNVDKFIDDVSTERKSGTYTQDGKTAKVVYKNWTVSIDQPSNYDKVLPYFVPAEVQSYLLADKDEEHFKVSLNESMHYTFICIAMKDSAYFLYETSMDEQQNGNIKPFFKKVNKRELEKALKKQKSKEQIAMMVQDFEIQFEAVNISKQDEALKAQRQKIKALEYRIFPCYALLTSISENSPCWIAKGRELFQNNCKSCHTIQKQMVGPALSGILYRRTEDWTISFIKNPAKVIASGDPYAKNLFAQYQSAGIMPGLGAFKDEEIRSIIYYIMLEDFEGVDGSIKDTSTLN